MNTSQPTIKRKLTAELALNIMSLARLYKVVQLEVSVPTKYSTIYEIATDLLEAVSAKIKEWSGSKGVTMDNLALTQRFLRFLVRLILAEDYSVDKKWIAVCSLVEKYLQEWPKMLSSIRYRKVNGVLESAQKRTTLNQRRNFQRMFAELKQTVADEIEMERYVNAGVNWENLQNSLTAAVNDNVENDLEDVEQMTD